MASPPIAAFAACSKIGSRLDSLAKSCMCRLVPRQSTDELRVMARLCREEVVGRNCRFLQGPGTDPAEMQKLRAGLAAERPTTVRLLNYKHDGTPFWNHLHVAPVRDARGKVRPMCAFKFPWTSGALKHSKA